MTISQHWGGAEARKSPTNLEPAWPMQWVPGLLGCTVDFVSDNRTDRWDGSADNSACHVSLRAWGQSLDPIVKEKTYSRKLFFDLYRHIMIHGHPHMQKLTRNLKTTTTGNFFLYSTTSSMIYVCGLLSILWQVHTMHTEPYPSPSLTIHVFATVTWRVDGLHSYFFLGFISPKCKLLSGMKWHGH